MRRVFFIFAHSNEVDYIHLGCIKENYQIDILGMKRGCLVWTGLVLLTAWMAVGTAAFAQEPGQVLKVTLDDAIKVALSDNPTIKVAEQQIEIKKDSKDEAWQSLLPSVDFGGTVQYTVLAAVMKLNGMEFKMG